MSGPSTYGKGDRPRKFDIPWEVYDLRYNLAFGKITQTEYNKQIKKAWRRAKKRGWRGSIQKKT